MGNHTLNMGNQTHIERGNQPLHLAWVTSSTLSMGNQPTLLDHGGQEFDHGGQKLDHGSQELDHGGQKSEHGAPELDPGGQELDHGGLGIGPISSTLSMGNKTHIEFG